MIFGEVLGGKGYSFGLGKDCMGRLEKDEEFAIKSEGWRETAHTQKAGRLFRGVEDGAEAYMRRGHAEEKSVPAERHRDVCNRNTNGGRQSTRGGTGTRMQMGAGAGARARAGAGGERGALLKLFPTAFIVMMRPFPVP